MKANIVIYYPRLCSFQDQDGQDLGAALHTALKFDNLEEPKEWIEDNGIEEDYILLQICFEFCRK